MEKLFYSLEEAAQRLGKSADSVRQMAASGQLSEFRDRDKLMFKKEQVDLLAGGEEEPLKLADSGELEPMSMQSSGSSISLRDDAKSDTGAISLLDDSASDEDANAVTRITPSAALVDPGEAKSASGSGSAGLLDLTREADDTSLGAGLLDDVYGNETVASASAPGSDAGSTSADAGGALFENPGLGDAGFENTAVAGAAGSGALAMVAAEPYDGAGSGLVGGLAIGAIAALAIAAFALITAMTSGGSSTPNSLLGTLATNWMAIVGGCAGLSLIAAGLGWFLGRKS